MNLHRSNTQPDWANVPQAEQNPFQRIAESTDGRVTPGNAVSVIGGLTVLSGLHDIYRGRTGRGIAKLGIGRIGDLVDGTVADRTGTKSPTGEAVDASIDKALMAASLPVLIKRDVLTKKAAGLLLAQNLASAATAAEAKKQGLTIHPSETGKKAVALQWSAIGLYSLAKAAKKSSSPRLARGLEAAGLATLAVATGMGTSAVVGYRRELHSQTRR